MRLCSSKPMASVKAFIWHKTLYETCSQSQKLNIATTFPVKRNHFLLCVKSCWDEYCCCISQTFSSLLPLFLLNAVLLLLEWETVDVNCLSLAHALEFHVVPIKMLLFLLTLTCTELMYPECFEPPNPLYRTDSLVSCSEICWSPHAG